VQIASPISIAATPTPLGTVGTLDTNDVVSPTRLLELARDRFELSLASLGMRGRGNAPSGHVTVLALNQVEAGVRSLRSVLVPTSTFELRARAASAIDQAKVATDLLRDYLFETVEFGERPPKLAELSTVARLALDAAKARLQLIIGTLH
jgi:hypothetical protein